MKRTILIFGILAGGLIIAYTFAVIAVLGDPTKLSYKDMELAEYLGFIRYLLLLVGVTMAMITYRRNMTGPIPYGRIFLVGLLVALITSFFVGVMEYTYVAFVDPSFYEKYWKMMYEGMKAKGATAAELEGLAHQRESYAWMQSPPMTGLFYFVETLVIGTAFAAIGAIFARRRNADGVSGSAGPALERG